MIVAVSLQKPHKCVVKSLVKIAAVSWHSLQRFIKPAPDYLDDKKEYKINAVCVPLRRHKPTRDGMRVCVRACV